jgi:glycogen operon protein
LRGPAIQFGYPMDAEPQDLEIDETHEGRDAPKCLAVPDGFDWGGDRHPSTPMERTVFYEVHVKGFTQTMPELPEHLRGTFAGLASDEAIGYLKRLGVTAIELLPIHAFADDGRLTDMGLANYWGYNTASFFALEPRFCANGPRGGVDEFRGMVKAMHAAGIEVILDVVYNHTCEGNHLGPTMSFKGIDNAGYYRLTEDRRYFMDYTGTGNTLDTSNPPVLRMVMDSLRYWVEHMHVDGFRFDLAPAISRHGNGAFDHRAPFLAAVAQDPVLKRVKMIAEPWDLGDYGYQVGGFPVGWAEWNGAYRDAVRDFWRGHDASLPQFAARFCGSHEIYGPSRRGPTASVNIVTVHDGFTLNDLVSYNDKHNEANGEENRDGESHNRSWNFGAEGPTDDAAINALRERQKRNFLVTLFTSRGVPLLLGGDEMGRTQQGSNNAYCQDNEVSWFDWSDARRNDPLVGFVAQLMRLREELPVLRRGEWPAPDAENPEINWYSVWGTRMKMHEWDDPKVRCVAVRLDGHAAGDTATVMLLFNPSMQEATFTLARSRRFTRRWRVRIDTGNGGFVQQEDGEAADANGRYVGGDKLVLQPHSLMLLTHPPVRRRARVRRTGAAQA